MTNEASEISKNEFFNEIKFGLMNSEGFYLTSEKFGNQISVTGTSLRSKQVWHFEKSKSSSMKGYLRSPHLKYLESDKNGIVTCNSDTKCDSFLFEVELTDEGNWMFKDCSGKYLSGTSKNINCQLKEKAGLNAIWAIHITNHPQCNIMSVARKRYVHVSDEEFRADEDLPWGKEYVITIEFCNGKYAFRDLSGRYLNGVTGYLDEKCSNDTLFVLYLNGLMYGFKCNNNKFLTVQGSKGKLIANKDNFGKDEQFLIEESKPQCIFTASNGKKFSVKQGVDVTANVFEEAGASEIFQIGFDINREDCVTIVTNLKTYLCTTDKSVIAKSDISMNSYFQMEWHDQHVMLKNFCGSYITSSSGGKLSLVSENNKDENSLFTIQIVNRPILVLRCEYGYVGLSSSSTKVMCNRGAGTAMYVSNESGKYRFKFSDGKSWKIKDSDSMIFSDLEGDLFFCQLHSKNRMVILAPNGKYLRSDKNGNIYATEEEVKPSIYWEY
ncbi:protein singed isoform X1 [Hydra vulgaris]|uniref:protein singed isoform X1 n=1 Tax=Hydra vulgaris TaxID=6087 RepID=UPI0002B4296D|nr:protein singed-like [Hydra vulgaris]